MSATKTKIKLNTGLIRSFDTALGLKHFSAEKVTLCLCQHVRGGGGGSPELSWLVGRSTSMTSSFASYQHLLSSIGDKSSQWSN